MRGEHALKWIAIVVPFVVCTLCYLPTLSGAFLSDDYAVVGALSEWTKQGSLLSGLLHQFYAGLDAPSHYYRPLTFVTFGVNYALTGADPHGWRLVNLCIHLASGALLFAIARRLVLPRDEASAVTAAVLATATFLLFPSNPEAVAWISGRYDLLATLFMLATIALFQRSATWFDGWAIAALVTAACGLASKESAVLMPVLVTAFAIARRAAYRQPLRRGATDAAPWIALTIGYFVLRMAIFGDALQVYPGTSPVASLVGGGWLAVLASAQTWFAALLPLPVMRTIFLIALATLLLVGGVWCCTQRESRARWWPLAATTLLSVAMVLPHLQSLSPNGEQGRFFYSTSALLALLVAAPFAVPRTTQARLWPRRVAGIAAAVLIAAEFVLLRASVAPWTAAGTQQNALLDDLPSLAMSVPASGYGFVLVPDHIGPVPFGRNAQGGMISPPIQTATLSPRLVVQTPDDLAAWPDHIDKGLVDALRRYPLSRVWTEIAAGHVEGRAAPTHYFCWDAGGTDVIPIGLNVDLARTDWLGAWRSILAEGRCAVGTADLPRGVAQ